MRTNAYKQKQVRYQGLGRWLYRFSTEVRLRKLQLHHTNARSIRYQIKKINRSPPALCNFIRWKISSWRGMGIMGSYLAVSAWRSVERAKKAWWQRRSCRSWKVRCSATACRRSAGNGGPAAPVHSQPHRRVESLQFHHHDEWDLGHFG